MGVITKDGVQQAQGIRFEPDGIEGIDLIERELFNSLSDSKGAIRDMCSHILDAGGKRIRPLLVLYSGRIFAGGDDDLIHAAVAAELIHMASLVHDDIIDRSDLRRSRPSINKVWGNQFAVLCGDYLFAKAFGILSHQNLIKSMEYMVEAIDNMCHGEILQAGDRYKYDIDIDTYYDRIQKKTATFLECCCKSGAAIGQADEVEIRVMGDYGLNLGLAFQIVDDILDFCGDIAIMGKPGMEDLREGNITLPVIYLLQDETYGDWIRNVIEGRQFSDAVMKELAEILKLKGVLNRCFDVARNHIQKAKSCLQQLPQTLHTSFLNSLADMLQARMN